MYQGFEAWSRGLDVGERMPGPVEAVRRTYTGSGGVIFQDDELRNIVGLLDDTFQDAQLQSIQRAGLVTIQEKLNRPFTSGLVRNFYRTYEDRYKLTDPTTGNVAFKYVANDGTILPLSTNKAVIDPSAGDSDNPVVFSPLNLDEALLSEAAESRSEAPYVMEYSSGGDLLGASDVLSEALQKLILFEYQLLADGQMGKLTPTQQRVSRQNILSALAPYIWRGDI